MILNRENILIYLSFSAFFVTVNPFFSVSIKLLIITICSAFIIVNFRLKVNKAFYFFLVLFLWGVLLDAFSALDYTWLSYSSIFIFFMFTYGYLLSLLYAPSQMMDCFEKWFFPLSLISMLLYLLTINFPSLIKFFYQYDYYGFKGYSLVILNLIPSPSGDGLLHRFSGFASEPGLFQLLINFCVYNVVKSASNKFNRKLFIYGFMLFLTNSTAGLLIFFIVLFMNFNGRYRLYLILMLLPISGFLSDILIYHVDSKLIGSTSFSGRLEPAINAINVIAERPFGIGSIEYMVFLDELKIGAWDSFSQIGLRYGVFGILILLFFTVRLFLINKSLGAIVFVSFFAQSIWYFPFISMLYFIKRN